MAKLYVNAYDPPDGITAQQLVDVGVAGIRFDALGPPERLAASVEAGKALQRVNLRPLFLLDADDPLAFLDGLQEFARMLDLARFKGHFAFQLGNEPDLKAHQGWRNPQGAAAATTSAYMKLRGILGGAPIIVTAPPSNMTPKALEWGKAYIRWLPQQLADDKNVRVGWHRYPPGLDPTEGHKGHPDRITELAKWTMIVGNPRKVWITETGLSQGPHRRRFPLCWLKTWLTEDQVAERLAHELQLWANMGVEVVTLYQLRDSADHRSREHFGLRRADGTWKALYPQLPFITRRMNR